MDSSSLLDTLRELERRLFRPEVRSDPTQLEALLHPSFVEVGASGRTYLREEVLAEFRNNPPGDVVWAQEFYVEAVDDCVALLRYRSAHIGSSGALSRFVSRTSLWQRMGSGWQIRFHQGTPTDQFAKHAT